MIPLLIIYLVVAVGFAAFIENTRANDAQVPVASFIISLAWLPMIVCYFLVIGAEALERSLDH